jgi:hypothetical protein
VLRKLIDAGLLERPMPSIEQILLNNIGGDALDAVVAAVATAHAAIERAPDPAQRIEGIIYAALPVRG